MALSRNRPRTIVDRRNAESILFPIAMFLGIGGLGKKDAEASFSSAYRKALSRRVLKIQHIGHPTRYADVIGLWAKDKRFIANTGCPRLLEMRGKNSFATLIQETSPKSDPRKVLSVLLQYGNVRRTKSGKYKLVKRFFSTNTPGNIAFEPIAYFLSDASTTARRLLNGNQKSGMPNHFWRKVETAELSDVLARKFSLFAKERSLTFLEELDDWLDAHKNSNHRKHIKRRRVGVGMFSIYSDPEVIDPTT